MIVFLDKDGVFEHTRCYMAGMLADPVAVTVLNGLFSRPDVRVVISATFRQIVDREGAYAHLKERGIVCTLHDDWTTGRRIEGRHNEIAAWLERNGDVDYVVLDDEHCAHPVDPARWIKCDPMNGMDLDTLIRVDGLAGLEYGTSLRAQAYRAALK